MQVVESPAHRHLLGCSRAGIGCLALIAVAGSAPCLAQKYPYNFSSPPDSSKYVRDYSIEVDDSPGHEVRVVEIQRTCTTDSPMLAGTRVIETWFRGCADYGSNGGPGHGYETWVLEDGNKVFLETTFISSTETRATGSRRGTSVAWVKFLGGTGRCATMRGSLNSTTEFDNDPKTGYNRPVTRGEYWLGKE